MTKKELVQALQIYMDDQEVWMEVDAGIALVGGVNVEKMEGDYVPLLYPEAEEVKV